jgi:hypothetical protein
MCLNAIKLTEIVITLYERGLVFRSRFLAQRGLRKKPSQNQTDPRFGFLVWFLPRFLVDFFRIMAVLVYTGTARHKRHSPAKGSLSALATHIIFIYSIIKLSIMLILVFK